MSSRHAFVLLDRDGTIIHDSHYLSDPDGVELLPGAALGLRKLRESGFGLLVVTNQSGIGRGYFTQEDMHAVHARLEEILRAQGVVLDGFLFCPHAPPKPGETGCDCRKPLPGMGNQAMRHYGMVPEQSFMVGDKACDVDFGRNCGLRTVLVRTGYGAKQEADNACAPDYVADDLGQAADWICALAPKG